MTDHDSVTISNAGRRLEWPLGQPSSRTRYVHQLFNHALFHTDPFIVNGNNTAREPTPPLNEPESNGHDDDGPPLKRRKIAESNKSSPRPVSPPWKRVHA